jgi:3-ketosteroid 9alpha-monooxygenase subunit A
MGVTMYLGWYQAAFVRELSTDLTPVMIGKHPLVLVRRGATVTSCDAVCPHRGANLAYGGQLDGDAIICPFHGHRITLGGAHHRRYFVRDYRTLSIGGSVFVLLSEPHENGLVNFLESLTYTHVFVPGFDLLVRVPPEYVIENVFDAAHFKVIHGLNRTPKLQLAHREHGEMVVEARFHTNRLNPWQEGPEGQNLKLGSRFCAHVFSPNLVVTELGDPGLAHIVITAATPTPEGHSHIRLSLAVRDTHDDKSNDRIIMSLLHGSKTAFEQDIPVWEHLVTGAPPRYAAGDRPVIEYRKFCNRFIDDS